VDQPARQNIGQQQQQAATEGGKQQLALSDTGSICRAP
jgi:hypothetical protein